MDNADPATQTYFRLTTAPGQTHADAVVVGNTGDSPIDLYVSSVDGLTGVTTGTVYANRQDPVAKAGTWVTPTVATIHVVGHTETSVAFTVHVPADATPGDHLAGLAFEDVKRHMSGDRFSVSQVVRAVVGVLVQVPGPFVFHAHIDGVDLGPFPGFGTPAALLRFGNDGSKLAKPGLQVSLDGPDAYHRIVSRPLDTVLPGDTISYPLAWPDTLQPGDYDVVVTITGGPEPVTLRRRVHLGILLRPQRAAGKAVRTGPPGTPWLLVAVGALGGALIGALLVRGPLRGFPGRRTTVRRDRTPRPTRGRTACRRTKQPDTTT